MLPKPVRLVEAPPAPNPRRLRIFLAEKNFEIPSETVNIMEGEHRTPEFLAWAGAPTVPAVELEDGTVLTETLAIFRYVEALQPEPNLLGRSPLEVAVIEMWHRRIEFGLLQHVAAVVRHLNPRMGVWSASRCRNGARRTGPGSRPRLAISTGACGRARMLPVSATPRPTFQRMS